MMQHTKLPRPTSGFSRFREKKAMIAAGKQKKNSHGHDHRD
jgi:hypothetical protein